jgi:hypothetical protein
MSGSVGAINHPLGRINTATADSLRQFRMTVYVSLAVALCHGGGLGGAAKGRRDKAIRTLYVA